MNTHAASGQAGSYTKQFPTTALKQAASLPAWLACIAALLISASVLFGCSCAPSSSTVGYVSPYDFSGLSGSTSGKLTYQSDGKTCSQWGIDVSDHQGVIDWNAVAGDGVEFAVIRLGNRGSTEGMIYADEQFEANMEGAQDAGISRSVYFFSQAVSEEEAIEEADFVIDALAKRSVDYVVFDEEPVTISNGRANNLSTEQRTACAKAFCERVAKAGYTPMIYGNANDIAQLDFEQLPDYDVWFAEYDEQQPTAQFDFVMWQYSNSGSIDGIDTVVDMNIFFTPESRK